jgi:predicted AAA+ superfamily ATPase
LAEALDNYKLTQGLIITENEEKTLEYAGKQIEVKPAWKWFLGH